jgi:hypothetical protein
MTASGATANVLWTNRHNDIMPDMSGMLSKVGESEGCGACMPIGSGLGAGGGG